MSALDIHALARTFGLAYAEACGKDPGDDYAILGQADRAGLVAAVNEALEQVAMRFEKEDSARFGWTADLPEIARGIREMKVKE